MNQIKTATYEFYHDDNSKENNVGVVILNIDFEDETFNIRPSTSDEKGFVFDNRYCTKTDMWQNVLKAISEAIEFAKTKLIENK